MLGLGFRVIGEQQIRGEIANQAVAAAVVGHQGDRGATEENITANDGEILRRGTRETGSKNDQLIAFERIEIEDEIAFAPRGLEQETIGTAAAIKDVAAAAAIEEVIAAAAIELVIAGITKEDVIAGVTT